MRSPGRRARWRSALAVPAIGFAVLTQSRGAAVTLLLVSPFAIALVRERLRLTAFLLVALAGLLPALPALRAAVDEGTRRLRRHGREPPAARRRRRGRPGRARSRSPTSASRSRPRGGGCSAAARPSRPRWPRVLVVGVALQKDAPGPHRQRLALVHARRRAERVGPAPALRRVQPLGLLGRGRRRPQGAPAERLRRRQLRPDLPAQRQQRRDARAGARAVAGARRDARPAGGPARLHRGRDRPGGPAAPPARHVSPALAGAAVGTACVLAHAQVDWHWQVPAVALPVVAPGRVRRRTAPDRARDPAARGAHRRRRRARARAAVGPARVRRRAPDRARGRQRRSRRPPGSRRSSRRSTRRRCGSPRASSSPRAASRTRSRPPAAARRNGAPGCSSPSSPGTTRRSRPAPARGPAPRTRASRLRLRPRCRRGARSRARHAVRGSGRCLTSDEGAVCAEERRHAERAGGVELVQALAALEPLAQRDREAGARDVGVAERRRARGRSPGRADRSGRRAPACSARRRRGTPCARAAAPTRAAMARRSAIRPGPKRPTASS